VEYVTEFDETKEICTIRVTGPIKRPQDSLRLQQLARDTGNETGCQCFLFDMRQAEIIGGTTMDAFEIGTVPVDPDRRQLRQKVALVYKSDVAAHKFMENVAVNRGYQLRVFDSMDDALAWLRPKKNT
jgi:hypothetical protein